MMTYTVNPIDVRSQSAALRTLWQRNLPEATAARFDWLYASHGANRAWLLQNEQRQPIGSTGLMLRTMSLGGDAAPCGSAIDLNVDREHRTVGPALALQRALVRDAEELKISLIYALPSPSAVPVMKRIGYRVIGQMVRWAKPLISEPKLRRQLKTRLLSHPSGVLADHWLQWTSAERSHRLPAGWTFTETASFGDGFDDLWQRGQLQFDVAGERTAAYLAWRYGEYPDVASRVFCLRDAERRLQGYAVIGVDQSVTCLSDLWFADMAALRLVLGEVLALGRRSRWPSLSFRVLCGADVSRVLGEFGLRRRESRTVFAWSPQRGGNGDFWLSTAEWYLTTADSDTDV